MLKRRIGMEKVILALDGGGDGFRKSLVSGIKVTNIGKTGPIKDIEELIPFISHGLNDSIKGIAYAVAGEINDHNKVVKSPNIHALDGKMLASITKKETGLPCIVGNDMECAVMGMAALLPKEKYFMGITWSSGIGLRFYKNGEIIAESEGGHIPLDPSPYAPLCGCGVRGCAESILGGQAVRRRVIGETQAIGISVPKGIDPSKFLDESYDQHQEWAKSIYRLICEGMGTFLANNVTLLRIPTIVWKGSFALNALLRVEKDIRKVMKKKLINPNWAKEVKFLFSPQPEEDGLIGAARIFEKLNP